MLAAIALAMALGAFQAPDANAVAAGPVNLTDPLAALPKFIERPNAAQFSSAYPHGAANVGMGGRAVLHCEVAPTGRLEQCVVARESPTGVGFGAAALGLAKYFRVDPPGEQSKTTELDLPIGFATSISEDEQFVTGPWLEAPSFADVGAAYPDIGGGVAGEAVLHCALTRDGALRDCRSIYQQPVGRDFDKAAIGLAHLFRMRIDQAYLNTHQPMATNVMMRLPAPYRDEFKQKRIVDPAWLAAPGFARLAELFPAQATAKSVTEGTGVVDCTVGADGALTACRAVGAGGPAGLGFAEAAVKAAGALRMSPWTDEGGPVDGAQVRVPIRFTSVAR
jgi:TonB family protein